MPNLVEQWIESLEKNKQKAKKESEDLLRQEMEAIPLRTLLSLVKSRINQLPMWVVSREGRPAHLRSYLGKCNFGGAYYRVFGRSFAECSPCLRPDAVPDVLHVSVTVQSPGVGQIPVVKDLLPPLDESVAANIVTAMQGMMLDSEPRFRIPSGFFVFRYMLNGDQEEFLRQYAVCQGASFHDATVKLRGEVRHPPAGLFRDLTVNTGNGWEKVCMIRDGDDVSQVQVRDLDSVSFEYKPGA